jgi:hypothetical protein
MTVTTAIREIARAQQRNRVIGLSGDRVNSRKMKLENRDDFRFSSLEFEVPW